MWLENAIGFFIAGALLVLSAKGFRCWYQEIKQNLEDR